MRREAKRWGKIISKKNSTGSKGRFFMQKRIALEEIYIYYNIHHIDFKSTSEIYFLGFLERPKFQIIYFF